MSGLEIVIVILGILFVIISILIVDNSNNKHEQPSVIDTDGFELTEEEENIIKDKVREIIEAETEVLLDDSDIKLSHISNDKIMAINEFSEQVVEKIESNHKDVIFLYDMLQKKQDEIKETLREAEEERVRYSAEIIKETEKAEAIMKAAAAVKPIEEQKDSAEDTTKKTTTKTTATKTTAKTKKTAAKSKSTVRNISPVDLPDVPESNEINRNEKILQLYKQKKTVLEISKALGMGQGEVKLIIDLYGH